MAFNIFQSPFEKLSLENQAQLLEDISEIKAALSESSSPFFSAILDISNKINELVEINRKIQEVLIGDAKETSKSLKAAELKALGITAESFGKGLDLIVEAVKAYTEVNPKKFDELIEGIVKMGDAFEKSKESFKFFLQLPKLLGYLALGILGFGLALIIATPLYIAGLPGAILSFLVIKYFIRGFSVLAEKEKDGTLTKGVKALNQIALAVALFGLAIVLSGPIYIAALVLMWPILGVIALFTMIFNILASKNLHKDVAEGARTLKGIAWTIALFGLVILLVGPLYIAGAIFVIPIILTLLAFGAVMLLISKFDKDIRKGIYGLLLIGAVIVVFALALWIWNKLRPEWEDIIQTIVVIGAFTLMLYLAGKRAKDMFKAAIALIIAGVSLIILAVAIRMILDAIDRDWEMLGMFLAVLGGFTVAMILLGNFGGNIMVGSIALILASVALILLGVGIKIILDALDRSWENMAMVGATVAMLGVEFGIVGIPVVAGFIALGSTAMITAGLALVVIGTGLALFKKTGWKEGDQSLIQSALSGIRNAFLGLDGDEGFSGMITAIAESTALASALVGISAMYIPAGIALTLIGASLGIFKKIGFKESDADTMSYVVQSVAEAFLSPFQDEDGDFDYRKFFTISLGVAALSKAGNTLAGLAEGVQAWANLTVPKWEYDEKSGEMKIKGMVKLSNKDFDNVAYGMQKVISAIAGPFAEVGKLEMGLTGDDPFYASIFGGHRYVSRGVRALSGIGGVMSGLAQGVQDFANLTITEWDVVQTKDGPELKPVKKVKLSDAQISSAVQNMANVAVTTATAFAEIGRINAGEPPKDPALAFLDAIFGGDLIKDGVEALSGVGDIMTGLAEGVVRFSNMEFVTHKIAINSKTGLPEMVPDKVIKIDQPMIDFAMQNMGTVATTVAKVFAKIGEGSWWNDAEIDPDDVEDGITAMQGIGDVMAGLAEGVIKFANMEFTRNVVKEINGVPTLVPKDVVKISRKDIEFAMINMEVVATAAAKAMANAGKYISNSEDAIEMAIDYIPSISDAIAGVAESIIKSQEDLDKVKDIDKINLGINGFITSVIEPFAAKDITNRMSALEIFTERIEIIAASADEMERIAKALESVSKSMGTFRKEVNSLDIKILSETRALYEAMGVVAEAGSVDELLDKYGKTIEETFEKLAELLEKFASKMGESTATATAPAATTTAATPGKETAEKKDTSGQELSQNISTMITTLKSIDTQLRSGIKTKQQMF